VYQRILKLRNVVWGFWDFFFWDFFFWGFFSWSAFPALSGGVHVMTVAFIIDLNHFGNTLKQL